MSKWRPCLVLVAVGCVLLGAACGADEPVGPAAPGSETGGAGGDDGGDDGGTDLAACDLTEPAVVAEVFGGSVDGEAPGVARNCEYSISGGAAETVHVFYYGTAADWTGIRDGYEENRGPLTDVSGVGEEAFHPASGEFEIVVRSAEVTFAVAVVGGGYTDEAPAKIRELAVRIASATS